MSGENGQSGNDSLEKVGNCRISGEIGRDGMAVVYRGVELTGNRTVAVKLLPSEFGRNPKLLAQFEHEAAAIAELNHPNIVRFFEWGREGDSPFVVMEFVEGHNLSTVLAKSRLSLPKVMHYAMQICAALQYAHGKAVVHRNLKPVNVLVERGTDKVKIVDFGIAQLETHGRGLKTIILDNASISTMGYAAPEQRLSPRNVDHRSDIYSFGVILYEMLTGQLPSGHFRLPSLIRPELPIGFDNIVGKCLAEQPEDRYQNAREIVDDLSRIAGGSSQAMCWRAAKYRWLWAGGVALVGLTAIGLVVFLSDRGNPGTPSVAPPDASSSTSLPAIVAPPEDDVELDPGAEIPPDSTELPGEVSSDPGEEEQAAVAELASSQADFARAQGLIGNREYKDAIAVLDDLIRRAPESPLAPEAQFAIARVCEDMGEREKAKTEYEQVVRNYPDSLRALDAVVARCKLDWETAPRVGLLKNAYSKDVQQRIIDELQDVLEKAPQGTQAPAALRLIAAIAQEPQLNDWRLAADSLSKLADHDVDGAPDALFRAAEIYDRKVDDTLAAANAYVRFARLFPQDKRVKSATDRAASLRAKH